MTDAAPREGWYAAAVDGIAHELCRRSCPATHCRECSPGSSSYQLAAELLAAARIDDLLRDAERCRRFYRLFLRYVSDADERLLASKLIGMPAAGQKELIDAEIAREKGRADG